MNLYATRYILNPYRFVFVLLLHSLFPIIGCPNIPILDVRRLHFKLADMSN